MKQIGKCINNVDYEEFFDVGEWYSVEKEEDSIDMLNVFLNSGDMVTCFSDRFYIVGEKLPSENPKVEIHKSVCQKILEAYEEVPSIQSDIYNMYLELKSAKLNGTTEEVKNWLFIISSYCISILSDFANSQKDICGNMTELYERKNHDYGDSFAQMRKEYPNAILIRVFDKYSRLNTLLNGKTAKVKDESIRDTIFDLANYCIMELVEMEVDDGNKPE